jgi:hypothetical protein
VQSLEDVRELLGPAWIIEGEDPERYEQLLARVADAVGPADFIDWLLSRTLSRTPGKFSGQDNTARP